MRSHAQKAIIPMAMIHKMSTSSLPNSPSRSILKQWSQRRSLSTFYDSQSGQHITLPDTAFVHLFIPHMKDQDEVLRAAEGCQPYSLITSSMARLVGSEKRLVDFSCSARAKPSEWTKITKAVKNIKAQGAVVRVQIEQAYYSDGVIGDCTDVQYASAMLADVGCDAIILVDTKV